MEHSCLSFARPCLTMLCACFFSGCITANEKKSGNTRSLNGGSSISTQIKATELPLQLVELNSSKNVQCEIHLYGMVYVHAIKGTKLVLQCHALFIVFTISVSDSGRGSWRTSACHGLCNSQALRKGSRGRSWLIVWQLLCRAIFIKKILVVGGLAKNAFLQVSLFPFLFYFFVGKPKLWAGCQILPRGIFYNFFFFLLVLVTKGNIWPLRSIDTFLTAYREAAFIIINVADLLWFLEVIAEQKRPWSLVRLRSILFTYWWLRKGKMLVIYQALGS